MIELELLLGRVGTDNLQLGVVRRIKIDDRRMAFRDLFRAKRPAPAKHPYVPLQLDQLVVKPLPFRAFLCVLPLQDIVSGPALLDTLVL